MQKLFWLDLEMSGLNVEKEVIIEAAAIITDIDFVALETYHAVLKQPQSYIDGMDEWNASHHKASGLIDKIPGGKSPSLVEDELNVLIDKYFKTDKVILAGNSIAQDRLFVDRYFKKFSARLHYRMLDVTAWKIIMNERFGVTYEKKNAHRALEDIEESIQEMKHYLSFVQKDKK